MTVSVYYQPSLTNGSALPDLRNILAQAPAAVWTARAVPPGQAVSSVEATLLFGQELVLRTAQESVLLISVGSMP